MPRLLALALLCCRLVAAEEGARVPWLRYEAEDGACIAAARVVGPGRAVGDPAGEAAGRRAVRLDGPGDGVAWTIAEPADGLVVRASIPDSHDGSGAEGDLAVRVGGRRIAVLRLTSRFAWLYGREEEPGNDPALGPPRRIYDESRLLLPVRLQRGERVELVREPGGPAGAWHLDFLEAEAVPPPLPRPAGLFDAAAEGVTPDNCSERLPALIARCDGGVGRNGIYLGPGRWRMEAMARIPHLPGGFVLQGAGMWHTLLVDERGRECDWGTPGFNLDGATARFADFAILGGGRTRKGSGKPFVNAYGTGSEMRNLWIERMTCGFWVGGRAGVTSRLIISGCRLRNLGADGINLCNGTRDSQVVDTTVRGSGDDGIAIWSAPEMDGPGATGCSGNVVERCTVELPWRAAGIAIYGGRDNTVRGCVVRDTLTYPGLTISSGFHARPFAGATVVEDLRLERCGGAFWGGQRFGAIYLHAEHGPLAGILLRRIAIGSPTFAGLHLQSSGQWPIAARCDCIAISDPGSAAVLLRRACGAVELAGCSVAGGTGPQVERSGPLRLAIEGGNIAE